MIVVTSEMPKLPPMLRARLRQGRRVIALFARQPGIRGGVDRHEQERQPGCLEDPRPRHGAVVDQKVEARHVIERRGADRQPEHDQVLGRVFAHQRPDQRHHQHDHEPARRDRQPGVGGRVTQQHLQNCGISTVLPYRMNPTMNMMMLLTRKVRSFISGRSTIG